MCLLSLLSSPYHNQSLLGIDSEFNLLKVNLPSCLSLFFASPFSLPVPVLIVPPFFSVCLTFSFLSLLSTATSAALCLSQWVSYTPPGGPGGGNTELNLFHFTPAGWFLWNFINDKNTEWTPNNTLHIKTFPRCWTSSFSDSIGSGRSCDMIITSITATKWVWRQGYFVSCCFQCWEKKSLKLNF